MKKVLLVLVMSLTTVLGFAQKHSTGVKQSDTTVVVGTFKPYVSVGLSLSSNEDFKAGTYPSVEVGMTKGNLSLGLVLGRQNLYFSNEAQINHGYSTREIQNLYYEPKITGSLPVGSLTGTLIFGWGGYFDTKHTFIEYGSGLGYTVKNVTYGITYSNFDKVDYITPSITYTFN